MLTGTSPDTLLDAYGTERAPNMEAVIELAIEMGKMICACDPDEVRARDDMFLAGDDGSITDIPPFPGISEGIILPGTPRAGELFVQGDVGETACACASTTPSAPDGASSPTARLPSTATSPSGSPASAGPSSPSAVHPRLTDVDGAYGRWFAEHGVIAALQRPDFVLFGTAEAPSDVDGLLRALQERLA